MGYARFGAPMALNMGRAGDEGQQDKIQALDWHLQKNSALWTSEFESQKMVCKKHTKIDHMGVCTYQVRLTLKISMIGREGQQDTYQRSWWTSTKYSCIFDVRIEITKKMLCYRKWKSLKWRVCALRGFFCLENGLDCPWYNNGCIAKVLKDVQQNTTILDVTIQIIKKIYAI